MYPSALATVEGLQLHFHVCFVTVRHPPNEWERMYYWTNYFEYTLIKKKGFPSYHDLTSQVFHVLLTAVIDKQKSKQNEICKLYPFILNSFLHLCATVLNNSCCQPLQIFIAIPSELTMLLLQQIAQVLFF